MSESFSSISSLPAIQRITPEYFVCAQIQPEHVKEIAALGFTALINNRPDGEDPQQPLNETIEKAARAIGLTYYFLPVVSGAITEDEVHAMQKLLPQLPHKTLAFCRSGTRSARLYQMTKEFSA